MRTRLLTCAIMLFASAGVAEVPKNVHQRGEFQNCRLKFERERVGHVAFMGGSITEMNGYRPLVTEFLKQRFPETKFTFTDAGISSTCSTTGAFRLSHDVLSKGPVDLFFLEFAVNDDQDAAHAARECRRGMEGILRQIFEHNPHADVVITYFVNEGMLAKLQEGKEPLSMAAHEQVAEHYAVTTSHHAREVAERITAGKLTWKEYGGVHPAPRGNQIAAGLIENLLAECWKSPLPSDATPVKHQLPELLDEKSYVHGRFLPTDDVELSSRWQREVPDWKSIPGSSRARFTKEQLFVATRPQSKLQFQFSGTAVGAYVLAGPDAGQLEIRIDGGDPVTVELYHRFSKGLHYPRTVMFAADLTPGEHSVEVSVAATHNEQSNGTAARVLHFVVN
ncbi:MAG: SGNH/GDSL hydrolase family protein [Planctomycetaceae bacterium]